MYMGRYKSHTNIVQMMTQISTNNIFDYLIRATLFVIILGLSCQWGTPWACDRPYDNSRLYGMESLCPITRYTFVELHHRFDKHVVQYNNIFFYTFSEPENTISFLMVFMQRNRSLIRGLEWVERALKSCYWMGFPWFLHLIHVSPSRPVIVNFPSIVFN